MPVGLFGERKIVFFPHHKPIALVGEIIIVVGAADAYDRFSAQVTLCYFFTFILIQMIR